MSWYYIQSVDPDPIDHRDGLWTVGYFDLQHNRWCPISDFSTEDAAAMRVHYLNGGAWPGGAAETNDKVD